MKRGLTGQYQIISKVGDEVCRAFIPDPLPPEPPLVIDHAVRETLDQALLSIGRLDSVSALLPDTSLFLYMYIRKEAVLSSQIEGTQSSLSDLLLFESEELPGVPLDDVREVSNYVAAMNHGLKRLQEGFPLSTRLIREIHEILLTKGRGEDKEPGAFRSSQNWIGGTRPGNALYLPPPAHLVPECMGSLEKFLHNDPAPSPLLIKAALVHVQFETIHPFLDGNGRLGRLLITLLMCAESALRQPLLYLSLYFKMHRQEYYESLQRVRLEGDWESWIVFFATGVRETAASAVQAAQELVEVVAQDRQAISSLQRASGSALRVLECLARQPILSISRAAQLSGLSIPAVTSALGNLLRLGIVRELPDRPRPRIFVYEKYVNILQEGTEPLP